MFWKLDLFLTSGGKGRNNFFIIHLGTLKGANINYWCNGCAWKKLWGWTVPKSMAMFIVPFCGNYGCDFTGWLPINEQFGGPVSSYREHMNNFFPMKGSPPTFKLFSVFAKCIIFPLMAWWSDELQHHDMCKNLIYPKAIAHIPDYFSPPRGQM